MFLPICTADTLEDDDADDFTFFLCPEMKVTACLTLKSIKA